ncbi:hypothetical protein H310_00008 [Aphanomyces invadans]|uniref:PH domain-containing protein n=1 Tax=Aphanomyces invadans TaxID=157072 RepID=A0A024UTZ4_9STRA|nr:hypothetical protein H310_00008 [Aphanomyces invadans]ETW09395.1 hypothetical protein H310_00008 [Aphanomyces invadans]|eukprot:XP_008860806.1 hypothetical protein H310_00008 [Aphanomyces invadans]
MAAHAAAVAPPIPAQPHNDILFYGTLDKRRDGAVRGGWATRLFLLTPKWLVYFRHTTKQDLLGEERERVPLFTITKIRVAPEGEIAPAAIDVPNEYSYIEITLDTPGKTLLMRTSKSEAMSSQHWVTVIEKQRQLLLNPNAIKASKPAPAKASLQLPSSSHPEEKPDQRRVAMVVLVDDYTERDEFVVAKSVEFGSQINLGLVKQGGACIIVLDDGAIARIGTQALMGSWDANETCWVECLGSSTWTEVEVSVVCQVVKQNPMPMTSLSSVPTNSSKSKEWIRMAEEGASFGYLLMAMLVHFMLGVQGFHWSHKACLTAGAALAISTIMNSTNAKSSRVGRPIRRMNSSLIPKVHLAMTVHRCRRHQGPEK